MIYVYSFYMYLYIHRPYEIWSIIENIHLERIYAIIMTTLWIFDSSKTWKNNRFNCAVTFFLLAMLLAITFSDCSSYSSKSFQDWLKVLLFYLIMITSVNSVEQFKIIFWVFIFCLGLYELHSFWEYLNGRGVYRMGIWRMVAVNKSYADPNSFAATINLFIPMLLPAFWLAKKKTQKLVLKIILILSISCIVLTGSRSGIACLLATIFGYILLSENKYKTLFVVSIFSLVVWLSLPDKMQLRYLSLIDPTLGPSNAQASADSRYEFFLLALEIWKNNPVLGIGPGCFATVSGTGMNPHSLYAQAISDMGLFGVIVILWLSFGLSFNYIEARKLYIKLDRSQDNTFLYYVVCATFIGLLQLLFLGFSGHNLYRYTWLWYGAFSVLALNMLRAKNQTARYGKLLEK